MQEILINSDFIKLGQLLKLAAIADSGVHAKILIANEEVKVNGEIETRRGRKIKHKDIIEVEGYESITVISEQ